MIALQDAQQIGLERLRAQADPVDAGFGQDIGLLGVERAGIGLDGPLAARSQDQPPPDDRRSSRDN